MPVEVMRCNVLYVAEGFLCVRSRLVVLGDVQEAANLCHVLPCAVLLGVRRRVDRFRVSRHRFIGACVPNDCCGHTHS
jgi:hypothetical protein